jgi:hypothetical protein
MMMILSELIITMNVLDNDDDTVRVMEQSFIGLSFIEYSLIISI